MKILLVEDDDSTASNISEALTVHRYLVNIASHGQTALELVKTYDYDLILLDVIVPGLDGIHLCRELRSQGYQMPILMLTAKQDSHDRVLGLEAGADDYVTKPFDLSELVARVRALLRRGRTGWHSILTWENLRLDLNTHQVTYHDRLIRLTPKEYGLLELFLRNPRKVFSRSMILDAVWNSDEFPDEGAVTTQIKGLRQKLKVAGLVEEWLETVYGLGYQLKPQPETPQKDTTATDQISQTQTEREVLAAIAGLWESFKPSLSDKFWVFEQAIAALQSDSLTVELQEQAMTQAHQLIGSLGTFDLPEGSVIARQIEQLLKAETAFDPSKAIQLSALVLTLKQVIQTKEDSAPLETAPQPESSGAPGRSTQLLIVDDDPTLTEQTRSAALDWGFQVEVAHSLTVARCKIAQRFFDLILLDLNFPDSAESGIVLLEELSQQHPHTPVLVMTGRTELSDRVAVADRGGRAFLQKPISLDQLRQTIAQVLPKVMPQQQKILMVDDDPVMLANVKALLEPWGLQVTVLNDPEQFWQVLEVTNPHLLILDVEMPSFSGLELCKVVRNDLHWGEIPVLFLTALTDETIVRQVFIVGADDYVRKPIVEPELVARVLNQLTRSQFRNRNANFLATKFKDSP